MNVSMNDPYASRTDRTSAIIARRDPVVYEGGTYADPLASEQVASYERNGFLMLENVFSDDEVNGLLDEVSRMSADRETVKLDEAIPETSSRSDESRVGKECAS